MVKKLVAITLTMLLALSVTAYAAITIPEDFTLVQDVADACSVEGTTDTNLSYFSGFDKDVIYLFDILSDNSSATILRGKDSSGSIRIFVSFVKGADGKTSLTTRGNGESWNYADAISSPNAGEALTVMIKTDMANSKYTVSVYNASGDLISSREETFFTSGSDFTWGTFNWKGDSSAANATISNQKLYAVSEPKAKADIIDSSVWTSVYSASAQTTARVYYEFNDASLVDDMICEFDITEVTGEQKVYLKQNASSDINVYFLLKSTNNILQFGPRENGGSANYQNTNASVKSGDVCTVRIMTDRKNSKYDVLFIDSEGYIISSFEGVNFFASYATDSSWKNFDIQVASVSTVSNVTLYTKKQAAKYSDLDFTKYFLVYDREANAVLDGGPGGYVEGQFRAYINNVYPMQNIIYTFDLNLTQDASTLRLLLRTPDDSNQTYKAYTNFVVENGAVSFYYRGAGMGNPGTKSNVSLELGKTYTIVLVPSVTSSTFDMEVYEKGSTSLYAKAYNLPYFNANSGPFVWSYVSYQDVSSGLGSGISITNQKIYAENLVNASFDGDKAVISKSGFTGSVDAILVLSSYSGTKLKGLKNISFNTSDLQSGDITVNLNEIASGDKYKLFVWNTLGDMVPLTNIVEK